MAVAAALGTRGREMFITKVKVKVWTLVIAPLT